MKSGSDVDICYRLGLGGHAVGLAPHAVVLHEDRASLTGHFRRFCYYATYQVLLFRKYKAVSGKKFVINPYPARRCAAALAGMPWAAAHALCGDPEPGLRLSVQLVEAAGVWCGDVLGSIRYRQIYL